MTLYEIDNAIQALLDEGFNYTVDEETGEVIFDDRSAELEQLQIDRAEKLDKAFIKETIKTTYAPDKVAIKKAIKDGQEVTGAYIEERKAVQIQ